MGPLIQGYFSIESITVLHGLWLTWICMCGGLIISYTQINPHFVQGSTINIHIYQPPPKHTHTHTHKDRKICVGVSVRICVFQLCPLRRSKAMTLQPWWAPRFQILVFKHHFLRHDWCQIYGFMNDPSLSWLSFFHLVFSSVSSANLSSSIQM